MNEILLPNEMMEFHHAHSVMCSSFKDSGLSFTLDGKLLGDIGEVLAAKAFGVKLCETRTAGVDGHAQDGRSVQIKVTARASGGPAFTPGRAAAKHLLFLRIDFAKGKADVVYNGPEAPIRALLPAQWAGTKVIPLRRVVEEDARIARCERLPRLI